MFSSSTKENLIELISDELCTRFESKKNPRSFVVKSKSPVPEEVKNGVRFKRPDLTSYFDEADYAIPQHVNSVFTKEGKISIKVLSADTDVFVLLCHFYNEHWKGKSLMDSFSSENKVINIKKTVDTNVDIVGSLVALHSISGCDTVPMMFGIGKAKSLNALAKVPLVLLGEKDARLEDVIEEGKKFVAKCYGQVSSSSSSNRKTIWINKTDGAKKTAKPPTLKSLPPTDPALVLNIKRAHFVAIMYKSCITGAPPDLDPCDFGYEKDGEAVRPMMLPPDQDIAPEKVLQMTRCNCSSGQCKNNRCGCVSARTNCSEFCGCQDCFNQKDNKLDSDSDNELEQ